MARHMKTLKEDTRTQWFSVHGHKELKVWRYLHAEQKEEFQCKMPSMMSPHLSHTFIADPMSVANAQAADQGGMSLQQITVNNLITTNKTSKSSGGSRLLRSFGCWCRSRLVAVTGAHTPGHSRIQSRVPANERFRRVSLPSTNTSSFGSGNDQIFGVHSLCIVAGDNPVERS